MQSHELPIMHPQTLSADTSKALAIQLKMADALSEKVSAVFEQFFQLRHQIQVFSVSHLPTYFWEVQDFYVAQKNLDPNSESAEDVCQLRISESFCEEVFQLALGPKPNQQPFSLSGISPFEVFLLEQFSKALFAALTPQLAWVSPDEDDLVKGQLQASRQHILWHLQLQHCPDKPLAIVFSVPQGYQLQLPDKLDEPLEQTPEGTPLLKDARFLTSLAAVGVNFKIGATKVKITELNQLATGDIVILEDSHISRWLLWDDNQEKWASIGVSVPMYSAIPRFIPASDEAVTQMNDMMSEAKARMATKQSPLQWENLQVDLVANFQPLKFPIKRLKELSEGLVLELSNVLDNRVMLNVDGQAVAWGELVVVGDKFAVRVKGLVNSPNSQQAAVTDLPTAGSKTTGATAPSPEALETETADDEDALLEELNLSDEDFEDEEDSGDWQ